MKMKKVKTISVLLLIGAMCMMSCFPVLAGTYTELSGSDTGINNSGIVTLTEKMTLEAGDTPKPEVTYTFAVQETGNPNVSSEYGNTGGATGVPVISSNAEVSFGSNTNYSDGTAANYSRVSETANVEFNMSAVTYRLPGVYYWTITKTAGNYSSNQGDVSNNNLSTQNLETGVVQTFYLYAIVTNDPLDDTQLQVTYGFYESDSVTGAATAKDSAIVDQYPSARRDLALEKIVEGNQGDRTKAFAFTIRLQGTGEELYNLEYSKQSEADSYASGNPDTISFGTPVTVYLKHDQKVTVKNLPEGVSYTITESGVSSGVTADGYSVSAATAGDTEGVTNHANSDGSISDASLGKDGAVITYTNTKQTITPTGLLLQFGPPAAGLLIAAFGIAAVIIGRRRRGFFAE